MNSCRWNSCRIPIRGERGRLSISRTSVEIGGLSISVSASVGITPALSCDGLDSAIELADKALYKAKAEGRDRVVFIDNNCVAVSD